MTYSSVPNVSSETKIDESWLPEPILCGRSTGAALQIDHIYE